MVVLVEVVVVAGGGGSLEWAILQFRLLMGEDLPKQSKKRTCESSCSKLENRVRQCSTFGDLDGNFLLLLLDCYLHCQYSYLSFVVFAVAAAAVAVASPVVVKVTVAVAVLSGSFYAVAQEAVGDRDHTCCCTDLSQLRPWPWRDYAAVVAAARPSLC